MNRYKCYNIPNISFEQLNDLEDNYLEQIHNDYLKKVEIKIENDDININIEPFNIIFTVIIIILKDLLIYCYT